MSAELRDKAAIAHFQTGVSAYEQGQYEVAVIECHAADELSRLADLVAPLGETLRSKGQSLDSCWSGARDVERQASRRS